MTVHARGYRPYRGPVAASPAVFALAREAIWTAWSRKAVRRIGIVYLGWFAMLAFFLYVAMGMDWFRIGREITQNMPNGLNASLVLLDAMLNWFYGLAAYLTALLAVFVGAPLIADDLQAGALPLYLVRPIRPLDYVLGKALVIPTVLAVMLLLPGLFFYVLVGAWQPPGETWPFLTGNLDVLGRVAWHYAISSATYTGLMLLLSSHTSRRAVAGAIAGAILFAGVMVQAAAEGLETTGFLAKIFLHANLPNDTATVFEPHSFAAVVRMGDGPWPDPGVVAALAAGLLLVGLLAAWRRARSVEVTG